MERLKENVWAATAALLAVVCLVVGVLALTVLRPAQEINASVTPSSPLVTTRDGLFSLIGTEASVTATNTSGGTVSIALGTTTDVKGWVGSSAHTEVVGVAADRVTLKTEEHAIADLGQSGETAQSGELPQSVPALPAVETPQSDAGQSDASQSVAMPPSVIDSDMWLDQITGTGSVTMKLADVPKDRALLIATDGTSKDLQVSIVWPTPQANLLAWIALGVGLFFAVLAGILHLVSRRGRSATAAAPMPAPKGEDGETIPAPSPSQEPEQDEAASLAAEAIVRRSSFGGASTDAADADSDDPEVTSLAMPAADENPQTPASAAVDFGWEPKEPATSYETGSDDADDAQVPAVGATTGAEDETVDGADAYEIGIETAEVEKVQPAATPRAFAPFGTQAGADAPAAFGQDVREESLVPRTEAATGEESPATDSETFGVTGRHGVVSPHGFDPPAKEPTDTGIIDLSSIRPGAALPTRRALREARERGDERFTVEGHEFDTGLIPVLSQKPQQGQASAADQTEDPSTGSWTSIMAGWKRRTGHNTEGK
ncbi:hypothetical protein I6B53_04600 [Schaalia sp. 19OD2882]|uniref:hypothetical protein n=1 Tax=Schaalia sp. 19OD2882 TaxID=2794089 RepID=UPI001C1EDF79|nr:hypothetical protein [Schaalia sp. 19OD2882]QWW20367.1 hypothetical protein I6B53_04600 [Schaalia sp. 19OD2882]